MANKKLRIVIIILACIVAIIFAYMYFQEKQLSKQATKKEKEIIEENKKEQRKETEEESKETELALDSEIVKQAETSTSKIGTFTKYIGFDINNLSKRNLIDTAINGLSKDQITFCISDESQIKATISIDDLNTSLNKYVQNVKLTVNDLKENKGNTTLSVGEYGYDDYSLAIDGENIHVIGACTIREEKDKNETVLSVPSKAITKDDKLFIYRKVAFGKRNNQVYNYYSDEAKTNLVETISPGADPTWEKYQTYKSTYEKNGDIYYLISTTKE